MCSLTGAYSAVALVEEPWSRFCDPSAFRPLVMRHDGSTTVVAAPRWQTFCVFEYLYLARGDPRFGGQRVRSVRTRLGVELGRQAPVLADLVVPVPASGVPAARGYAEATGLPLMEALARNEYVGRTFIEPNNRRRAAGLNMKFILGERVFALGIGPGDEVIVPDDKFFANRHALAYRSSSSVSSTLPIPPVTILRLPQVKIATSPNEPTACRGRSSRARGTRPRWSSTRTDVPTDA